MKNYFKKFSGIFVISLILILGCCVSAFAEDSSQSIKINNTTLSFNNIIYVDGTIGDDSTGDGSENIPYKTLEKAETVATTNDAIVFKGNFTATNKVFKSGVSYIGYGKETVINTCRVSGTNVNLYRFVINANKVYENYSISGSNFNLNNIVYTNQYTSDSTKNFFENYKGVVSNCLFGPGNWKVYTYGKCSYSEKNTACTTGFFDLKNVTIDSDYNITSDGWKNTGTGTNPDGTQANIGVYGGEFAWGEWNSSNESILLDKSTMDLTVGDSGQLIATTTPSSATVTWTSSDESIATVDSEGNITAVSEGTCTITASLTDYTDITDTCSVTVTNEDESISLNKSSMDLTTGDSETLIATTTPSAVNVSWSSSDTSVATVDSNGTVTAVGLGTAVITATTTDGSNLSDSCTVNVTEEGTTNPTQLEYIVNTAYAQGDNTNNAKGSVSIIFHGTPETILSVVKTADVDEVWVGDNFTYTIVVTNTGLETAKDVVITDSAPNHIEFNIDGITTTQGEVDSDSTSSNVIVNAGDIDPGETVTIKIPVTVVE